MSFLEDLSDSFDDYSGLMMAGGMLQRQSMLNAQKQNAAAAAELLELQREQAVLQKRHNDEAMAQMRAEQQRREASLHVARECRYLITYASQILHDAPKCPLTLGTAAILCQMVDARLSNTDLAVDELTHHQQNQGRIRQACGGGSAINAAIKSLDEITVGLNKIASIAQDFIDQRDTLCPQFYKHQKHPLWVAYCIPEESSLRNWMPPGYVREQIADAIKYEYSTLAIPANVSRLLLERLRVVLSKQEADLQRLIDGEPTHMIAEAFRSTGGLAVWTDDYSHMEHQSDDGLSVTSGPPELALSRPPEVRHFKVGKPVLLFLNLAEDVDDGSISLDPTNHGSVKSAYRSFNDALRQCDRALDQMQDIVAELLTIQSGELLKTIQASLKVLKHRAENEQAEIELAYKEIKSGNVSRAETLIDHLLAQNNFAEVDRLRAEIRTIRAPLEAMKPLQKSVLAEYKRLNTPLRRVWGPGFGKVYNELEDRLRKLNAATRASTYPNGSELTSEVDRIIASVLPACELAELCFTWKAPRVTLSDLLPKLKPRGKHPGSIYINAMCAMAAADGDFCTQEQREIETRLTAAPVNLTPGSVKNVIATWCDKARQGSVQHAIAQSIVDTVNLKDQRHFADSLLKDLYAVAKSDGKASHVEGIVYNQIRSRLKTTQ